MRRPTADEIDAADRTAIIVAAIEDQGFIADVRQDVPRLATEVRRLRTLLAQRPA